MKGIVKGLEQEQAGVTLIELLVVMAIIGIIAVVGVNMMGGVVSKQRLRTASGEVQTRIRAAQLLAVVKNVPVTVEFDAANGEYWACLDNDFDGDCTDEAATDYLNLDTGRTGTKVETTKELHPLLSFYDVDFGDVTASSVTFKPPSGLPREITTAGAFVNGAVCLQVEVGDDSDTYEDQYSFRRITVNPIVGRAKMWRNKLIVGGSAITAEPDCDDETATEWDEVF